MKYFSKQLFLVLFTTIFLVACAKNEVKFKNNDTLTNRYWKVIEIRGDKAVAFDNQREAHIILDNENKIIGSDSCNRIFGSYKLDGNKIDFSHLASTRMACMKGMTQAHNFSTAFAYVKSYKIEKNSLYFLDENEKVILKFVSVNLN